MKPFGEFAAERFIQEQSSLPFDQKLVEDAAWVYLFRFDRHLTTEYVQSILARTATQVAATVGRSFVESKRNLLHSFHGSSSLYFASQWDNLQQFVDANSPALWNVRRLVAVQLSHVESYLGSIENPVLEIDEDILEALEAKATPDHPVVLKVFADYCSKCLDIATEFKAAACALLPKATFVELNGPKYVLAARRLGVMAYPSIIRFQGPSSPCFEFPPNKKVTASELIAFALKSTPETISTHAVVATTTDDPTNEEIIGRNKYVLSKLDMDPMNNILQYETSSSRTASSLPGDQSSDPTSSLPGQWARMLQRQGIDKLEALVRDRDTALHSKIDDALRCHATKCALSPSEKHSQSAYPVAILLGGGMGSGKTSVVELLSQTEFWENRGASAVIVEADAFKQSDPVYNALSSLGVTKAAGVVHGKSLESAEQLLILASQKRRDIVFDGTMSWRPFVEQTIAMLRDPNYFYVRGDASSHDNNGSEGEYWVRSAKRETPVSPYRIELVGVTIDAAVAVERAIVRSIMTGRSVPIESQLRSHQLFSEHFEHYIKLVDAAYLFNTADELGTGFSGRGSRTTRGLIASKPGCLFPDASLTSHNDHSIAILNEDAYRNFLKKQDLNVNAHSTTELYMEKLKPSHHLPD